MGNPQLAIQFEKRTQDKLSLESWVDVKSLDAVNSVQDVYQRGFQFPSSGNGMKFTVGTIRLESSDAGELI